MLSPVPRAASAAPPAVELAGRGARLVLVARGAESLEEAAAEVRAAGATEVVVCPADVTDEDAVRAAVDAASGGSAASTSSSTPRR